VRRGRGIGQALVWPAVVVATIWLLFPFYWAITTSVKTGLDLYRGSVPFVNYMPSLRVWAAELGSQDSVIRSAILNSVIIASGSTFIAVVLGGMAAYGLASLRGRGGVVFLLTIICLGPRFILPIAVLIPFYLMMRFFGLVDTQFGMILADSTFALPFVVLVMRDAFANIPREIEEAGVMDGCSGWQLFWRITYPLTVPAIAAAGILAFAFSWNDFLFAMVMSVQWARPVTYILAGTGGIQLMMVRVLLAMLPPVLLALFVQRYLVRALTLGAVR
jgi:multiple sugar transport system permease protein